MKEQNAVVAWIPTTTVTGAKTFGLKTTTGFYVVRESEVEVVGAPKEGDHVVVQIDQQPDGPYVKKIIAKED